MSNVIKVWDGISWQPLGVALPSAASLSGIEVLTNKTIDGNNNTIKVKRGTTINRPINAEEGDLYYDTTIQKLLNYSTVGWVPAGDLGLLPVLSGGTLSSDSTYYYRVFTANSTLTVSSASIACDVLVVGGGAGGSGRHGGGGGAGSLLSGSLSMPVGSYPIVIGAGSPGVYGNGTLATNGSNTTAFGTTLLGGGYGGAYGDGGQTSKPAGSGGSGGGAGYGTAAASGSQPSQSFGTVFVNPGAAGPSGVVGGGGGGAGGGGSGANGGPGYQWLDGFYYAGGGGGSAWDANSGNGGIGGGGGGNISTSNNSTGYVLGTGGGSARNAGSPGVYGNNDGVIRQGGNAGANTGSGAGASAQSGYNSYNSQGGNGGSGIVVIRYTKASVGG